MKLIDISWPISEKMTAYKDNKTVAFKHNKTFKEHNVVDSTITFGSHTGTHIDAPMHFVKNGESIDQVDLTTHNGWCQVLDLTKVTGGITKDHLKNHEIKKDVVILLKTKNSARSPLEAFDPEFVYLTESGANYLVGKQAKGVGIDYLGIERNQPKHETHTTLMKNKITIIEGLRLQHVDAGEYFLFCLPIYVLELEAAPARAVLIQE